MKRMLAAIALAAIALPVAALADTQITAVGSTALLPLVKQSATDYSTKHPDVKISVSGGGSYVGIAQASSGAVDMGDSDVVAPGNSGPDRSQSRRRSVYDCRESRRPVFRTSPPNRFATSFPAASPTGIRSAERISRSS